MIISQTPFRYSFVGGGTDLKKFYISEPGQVLSTTINKYLYVIIRRQAGVIESKYRINWSKIELKNKLEDIEHPIVRETLKIFKINYPIEISILTDIPAKTGLGSSSSFAVGLINALNAFEGKKISKYDLAMAAANIEINILGRSIGKQDHFAAAYGGFNIFTFNNDESVSIENLLVPSQIKNYLKNNFFLTWTALTRDSSEILKSQLSATENKREVLSKMKNLIPKLKDILIGSNNIDEFGEIINHSWELKRSLTNEISSPLIDKYYKIGLSNGAIGGKLLGAGGGGFILFLVKKDSHNIFKASLPSLQHYQFGFDKYGSKIIYSNL